ncbi:hypothetical protein DPEC_G00237440 [Dallia pectoralis]|uniref:Uncharacterized protein n=1 Tax=Dallia pectoralis TaxID=75939 RepID=A0ACC2FYF5_DALPE|nr:hypothetical protein DPEC_G00237440 [Dallia pectoralis]
MSSCQTRKRRIQCCFRFLRQRLISHIGDKMLELPAPPELANTTIRQPESPASSDISGCSRPTPHRSPTRSESSEAFSPESASKVKVFSHTSSWSSKAITVREQKRSGILIQLETLEDFAEEEAHLKDRNLWEQRVSQLSKVGGRNNKDCVHKVMDRY